MKALRFVALVLVVAVIASALLSLLMGAPPSALVYGILSLLPVVLIALLPLIIALQLIRWVVSRTGRT